MFKSTEVEEIPFITKEKFMFGNKNLSTRNKSDRNNDRSFFSGLTPWSSSSDLSSFSGFSPFTSLRDEVLDLFDNFTNMIPALGGNVQFIPKIEIKDKGSSYLVSAEVPGMSEKDMNVTIRDNYLILEGEKKEEHKEEKSGNYRSEFSYGSFYRAIPLTDEIDTEKVNARYRNGILEVTVEKRPEAQRKAKKIPISMSKSDSDKQDTKH